MMDLSFFCIQIIILRIQYSITNNLVIDKLIDWQVKGKFKEFE